MEMTFETEERTWLETAVRQTQSPEISQELRLGEGMGDVSRVLGTWAQPILRGKEWYRDSISVTGGCMVRVLYAPEDGGEAQVLDTWIPFQSKWSLPETGGDGEIQLTAATRFADARIVSPRKLMIRVGLSLLAQALCPRQREIPKTDGLPEGAQVLKTTYPLDVPVEAGEGDITLEETLNLPENGKIVYGSLDPELTENRILGDKMALRGNGNLHLLLMSEDGLQSADYPLAFSRILDLNGEYGEDARGDLSFALTNLEMEEGEGEVNLRCTILSQYCVRERMNLECIEDAYLPGGKLELKQETLQIPAVLESREERVNLTQTLPAEAGEIADVSLWRDFPRQRRCEEGISLSVPWGAQVVYYDKAGNLQGISGKWETETILPADENASLGIPIPTQSQLRATPSGDRVGLEGSVNLNETWYAQGGIPVATGGVVEAPGPRDGSRPTLMICRYGAPRLWDLAKEAGSTVEAIRTLNHLENDPGRGKLLIIPVLG